MLSHQLRAVAGRIHLAMRDFLVERVALRVQAAQLFLHIGVLQQRAAAVIFQAPIQLLGQGVQIHRIGQITQGAAIVGVQHDAATCGQYGWALAQCQGFGQGFGFHLAERGLALARKIVRDAAADKFLNYRIRIDDGALQQTPELAADGGFARAR